MEVVPVAVPWVVQVSADRVLAIEWLDRPAIRGANHSAAGDDPSLCELCTGDSMRRRSRSVGQEGEGFEDVLEAHNRILRDSFGAHGGSEVQSAGDGFFFVFARARDAVAAAVEAQRALAAESWPEGSAVKVRMGIHTGEVSVADTH